MPTNPNPFLRSPFDAIIDQQEDAPQLSIDMPERAPSTPPAATPAIPAASAATPVAPAATPGAAPAAKRRDNLAPPDDLREVFEGSAKAFNVPVNVLMALAHQESRYNPLSVNAASGAKGIMNFMDATAKSLGINPMDPNEAIPAVAKQLRERLDKGYSMDDAVKEHFAGTDRAGWKEKTAAYGREVLDKAGQLARQLYPDNAPASAPNAPRNDGMPADFKLDPNHFSAAMPKGQYLANFMALNPGASPQAQQMAMDQYDQQAAKRTEAAGNRVQDRFAQLASPAAMFDAKLSAKLQARNKGVVQVQPGKLAPAPEAPAFDAAAAERESKLSAAASYLGKSTVAGLYDLAGAGGKLLDDLNPFTLSESDAAVLFRNQPEKLKALQEGSTALVLSRFSKAMTKNSEDAFATTSARAKRDYGALEYATTDTDKAAYASPVKVIGDALRSAPSTVALAMSAYLTRGASLRAEQGALAAGLSQEVASAAGVAAGARMMGLASAGSEGAIGYAQQALQTSSQLDKTSDADMAKSPLYRKLLAEGYAPAAARAQVVADTSQQAGAMAGIVDAAVNAVGGHFLGKIMTEGGTFIPRVMKGAANEAATEFVQSAGEQAGQNLAVRSNVNPNQALSDGVLEQAIAGAAVGGVSGGAVSGVIGHGPMTREQEVANEISRQVGEVNFVGHDAAARAALDPNHEAVDPRQTVKPRGALTAATEQAAAKPKVTATTPDGASVTGTIVGQREDDGGNLVSQIIGDDGTVHEFNSAGGGSITEVAAPAGPLSSVVQDAAASHSANPAPLPEVTPAPSQPAGPEPLEGLSIDDLFARNRAVAAQIKQGRTAELVAERKRIEKEIGARAAEAKAASKPAEEPISMGPFDDRAAANKMLLRAAESTAVPHEVIEKDGKFTIKPIKDDTHEAVPKTSTDGAGGAAAAVRPGATDGKPVKKSRPVPVVDSADAAGNGGAANADPVRQEPAADVQPALSETKHEWETNPYTPYSFADAERAAAFIKNKQVDTTKFEAVQTGKARWKIQPRAESSASTTLDSLAGKPINDEWTAYAKDSGTLNIDRAAMPQVKAEHRGALVNFLNARGIAHEQMDMPAADLKPTQREFSPAKVQKAREFEGGDRSILVSADGHVLDGHHQWMAKLDANEPVKVIRLDAPIKQLLEEVAQFPSAEAAAGATPAPAAPAAPEATPAPKPAAPAGTSLEAARAKHARQDEAVRKAAENIARRKAAKEAAAAPSKVPEVAPAAPIPMDEETYLAKNGASRQDIGDAGLHRSSSNVSAKSWSKKVEAQSKRDADLVARREELRAEYQAKIASGELREFTSAERAERTASGSPDLESTQAAQRLIAKRAARAAEREAAKQRSNDSASDAVPDSPAQITDTPAFKKWFGASQVVDEHGKPLAMYHGTSHAGFDSFDTYASNYGLMGMGGYFTADPGIASSYTSKGKGDSPGVYKVFLSIQNAIDMDGKADPAAWQAQFPGIADFHEGGDTNESWYRAAEDMFADERLPKWEGAEAMQDGLRAMGHDGITHIGGGRVAADSVRHKVFIAFEPEQIKSATGNDGTFDPANPDIRYSVSGDDSAVKVTKTDAFKKWFGNSKVVDSKGQPLVVYHGTTADITEFDTTRASRNGASDEVGTFFTTNPKSLRDYTRGSGGNIMPVNLAISNPYEVTNKQWGEGVGLSPVEAKAAGYDGYIIRGQDRGDTYVAFRSEQIKSATGNAGTFDPANPDIRFSVAEAAVTELHQSLSDGEVGPVIAGLIDSGAVVLHADASTLPGGKAPAGVQALTERDGTIHLVAAALTRVNASAVLLHEAFHAGGQKLIGTGPWNALMGRLTALHNQGQRSGGAAKTFYDQARDRVAIAKAKGAVAAGMEAEEFGAYAIEHYESAPASVKKWVSDLSGAVKAWALRRFGRQLGQVTPAQLAGLARMALMDAQGQRAGAAFSSSDARTIEVDGVRRPIENSKGQLVGQTFEAQKAFWQWFSNSAVVDDQGRPQPYYHATRADFSEFSKKSGRYGRKTFSFHPSPDWALQYGNFLMPVYLRATNLFDYRQPAHMEQLLSTLKQDKAYESWWEKEALNGDWEMLEKKSVQRHIKQQGHDGFYVNDHTGDEPVIQVFKPDQIKSAIGNDGAFSPGTADIRYSTQGAAPDLTPDEQGLLRRVQASVQDNLNRVKQVQERIESITGAKMPRRTDYYAAEVNRPGRIAARLEDMQDQLTGPLMERLAASKYTPADLEELLHAMHAHERNEAVSKINADKPDGGSGMTDADANTIIERRRGDAGLHELAKEARAIARATLDLKLAYGLVTPFAHETLATMYENYVPLKGDGEYGPKIKRAMGHDGRDEHILGNIARDYAQAVVAGEKNLARQSLLQMVLQYADDKLWTARVPPKGRYVAGEVFSVKRNGATVATYTQLSQVSAFLDAKGAQAGQYTVDTSGGEQVVEFTKPLQDNEVMVYVQGQPVRLQIHDEKLASQLRPLDQGQMGWAMEVMRGVNRHLSKVYTGYNPSFILRNMARDAMTGSINMLGNQGAGIAASAWASYPGAARALFHWARTKQLPTGQTGDYLNEYRMHGGKVGASWLSDLEQQGKSLTEMYDNARGLVATVKDTGASRRTARVAWNKSVGRFAHIIETVNQATENALRLGLFIALRKAGKSPGEAAQAAKGVTVDFDRKGTATPALGAFYLFMNPAVQGTANMTKTLVKGEHKAQAWTALAALASLGYMLAAGGMDDDRDRWLGEDWEVRSKNMLWRAGDHQVKIPVSQEFAPFFAVGAALAETTRGESAMHSSARVFSSFIDAYFPLNGAWRDGSDNHLADAGMALVPTVAKPIAEIAANRNSFGSALMPETGFTKDRPDNLKMFRATKNSAYDKAAQAIAGASVAAGLSEPYDNDITKVSPETLKMLWRTYTGGLGTFIADGAGLAGMLVKEPDAVESSDVVFAKDFYRPLDVKPVQGRYYELTREAERAATAFKQAVKNGDGDAIGKMMADPERARLMGMTSLITKLNKAAGELADQAVDVNADKTLSDAAKRTQLKVIDAQREELYRLGIEAFTGGAGK